MTIDPGVATDDPHAVIAALRAELAARNRDYGERIDHQSATIDVLKAMSASPGDAQPVFELITRRARILCDANASAIWEYDGRLLHFRCNSLHEDMPADEIAASEAYLARFPMEPNPDTAAGRVVLEQQLLTVRVTDDEALHETVRAQGIAFTVGLPLLRNGEMVGVLMLNTKNPGGFSDSQVELLKTFAEQAVIAIGSVATYRALRARTAELQQSLEYQAATIDVLKVMSTLTGDAQPVFEIILRRAMELCDCLFGGIFEYDGEVLHYRKMLGFATEALQNYVRSYPTPPTEASGPGRAILHKCVIHIRDLVADEHFSSAVKGLGHRSAVFLPLLRDGEPIGVIGVGSRYVDGFTDAHIELLKTFAEQAVIAIGGAANYRALETRTGELQEALEHQTATAEVLGVINASQGNLVPVFEAMLDRAMRLCGVAFGLLYTWDGARRQVVAQLGLPPAYAEYLEANAEMTAISGLARQLVESGRPQHVLDTMEIPDFLSGHKGARAIVELGGARTMLLVPLRQDSAVVGYFTLFRQEVRAFDATEIALMESFAAQAVIAMENARLLGALREQTEALARRNSEFATQVSHQAATIDVLKVMSAKADDLQPVFDVILRRAMQLTGSLFGLLHEYDGDMVHLRAHAGWQPDALGRYSASFPMQPQRDSITCRSIMDRKLIRLRDVRATEGLSESVRQLGHRSALVVPLLRDGAPLGAISLGHADVDGFTDAHVELLSTFAEQAVIAIGSVGNVRALQERTAELTRSVAELQALEEVLRAVNSSLDLETVLSTIINRAVPLAQADEGLIYEFDAIEQVFVPKAAFGMSEDRVAALRERRIRIGEAFIGRSAAAREPVHMADVQTEGTPEERAFLQGIQAVLAVPLLREDRVVGGLVIRRRTEGAFASSTVTLMQTFAAQSVLAIENARLFEAAGRARAAAEVALADLRRTQDRLVQTEKLASLGQLTAGIAHEIKNPLNFVNNFSDLSVGLVDELHDAVAPDKLAMAEDLRAEIDDITATLKGNLEKIVHHGRRADSIVKNMLQHSRTGASELREVDLNATVEEAVNLAYHGARAEQPGFNISLERDFDPAAGIVDLYPQEFTRVLLNLCSNGFYAANKRASEAAEPGYAPTLRISTRDLGDRVEIRVRDNGTGIPPDIRDKLFQPFFTTKPTGEGTGLGLSMSHDIIVKQHGGSIAVDSVPGAFTEFTVTLPRRPAGATA